MKFGVLAALAVLATACSGGGGDGGIISPPPPPPPPQPAAAVVAASDSGFVQDTVTIQAGQSVKWVNTGSEDHVLSAEDGTFGSNLAAPGGTKEYPIPGGTYEKIFTQAGTYYYTDLLHHNFNGVVVVTP
jgi:plastocyanin